MGFYEVLVGLIGFDWVWLGFIELLGGAVQSITGTVLHRPKKEPQTQCRFISIQLRYQFKSDGNETQIKKKKKLRRNYNWKRERIDGGSQLSSDWVPSINKTPTNQRGRRWYQRRLRITWTAASHLRSCRHSFRLFSGRRPFESRRRKRHVEPGHLIFFCLNTFFFKCIQIFHGCD